MPVFERGYLELREDERPGRPSWTVLPQEEWASWLRNRKLLILWFVCIVPHLVLLVRTFMALALVGLDGGPARGRGPSPAFLGDPESMAFYAKTLLEDSLLPVLVFLAATAIRTVSLDRKSGALELYFTRPLSPWRYILGRWTGAAMAAASVTALPVLLVWLTGALAAPDWGFLKETLWIPGRILLQGAFFASVLGICAAALSSMSSSVRTGQILWVGFLAVMHLVFSGGLRRFLHEEWPAQFSPWAILQRVGEAILGVDPEVPLSLSWCAALSLLLVVLSLLVLRRNLKPLEVVG